MRVERVHWSKESGWSGALSAPADLVLAFGSRETLAEPARMAELAGMAPGADVVGCSTGGQFTAVDVDDDALTGVALGFDHGRHRLATVDARPGMGAREAGIELARRLAAPDLAGVLVLSDGLAVNGSALVAGIVSVIGRDVPVTGGLAGDGPHFRSTLVAANGAPRERLIAAIGFYGSRFRFGHGSAGGWDVFGPRREITRSEGNVLKELDGRPALELYMRYLGEEEAKGLPGTALLFPLRIRDPLRPSHEVVRTVLSVDHSNGWMTFAGDMPAGWSAQLMRGSFDRLAQGAADAGRQARLEAPADGDRLALLVSCIGRRLLMGQRAHDEVEAACAELGSGFLPLGFYSYGEISPHAESGICELHNQTMTVTTLLETAH